MIYKTLKKVSDVCQLIKPNFLSGQSAGVTVTSNGDTFTVNGTSTKRTTIGTTVNNWTPIIGHKMLVCGCPEGGGNNTFTIGAFNQSGVWDYGKGGIGTVITTGTWVGILFESGITFDNLIFKPQLFDLTEMYGAGNEPTTVEEFKQKFPNELYDYKPYCFVKSYKTLLKASDDKIITSYKKSLVCKTKNLFDKSVFSSLYDIAHADLIDVKENGWIVQGKFSSTPGTGLYYNGWFRPGYTLYDSNIGMLLDKAGKVTVSAYYTVLENNSISDANIYLYGTRQKVATHLDMFPDVGIKTRQYVTFDINDGEEGIYYPIFTLNSSKILIEDIQVEYGDTPTEYHPYGYL